MISVSGLVKRFGDRTVIEGVSLEVAKGEVLAIMGSSGGGKTTLLRCIAGLIQPDEGAVHIDGVSMAEEPERARSKLGMVFQSSALFDYLSVRQNVEFGVKRHSKETHAQVAAVVDEMIETVGLKDSQHLLPGELSGGMKKRVGLARALAMRPEAMLYDEPVTGLDPVTAYRIDQLIIEVREKYSVATVVVSHDVSSVFRIADRIAFLDRGKLAFLGSPEAFESSDYPAVAEILAKARATLLSDILTGQ